MFDLCGVVNSARGTADRFAARLGPDEWLLVAPDGADAGIAANLAGHFHSLVDISCRQAALTISGPAAPMVLNAGSLSTSTFVHFLRSAPPAP